MVVIQTILTPILLLEKTQLLSTFQSMPNNRLSIQAQMQKRKMKIPTGFWVYQDIRLHTVVSIFQDLIILSTHYYSREQEL
jgi:hypothetical protein